MASVPGRPRSMSVLVMCRRPTFECLPHIYVITITMRMEQGMPGSQGYLRPEFLPT